MTIAFTLIASEVLYIPRSDLFIGWDAAPHAYLVTRMNDLLANLQVRGVEENWFLGIPLFYLYPPLGFICALIPKIIFLNHLTPVESFNIFIFLIPFLIFISSYYAGRKVSGAYGGRVAGMVSLFYLFLPSSLEHQGVGLHAFINLGLFASAIALCFQSLLFAELVSTFRWWWCGLLLCLIILTHQLTSIFALLFVGLYSLTSITRLKKGACSIVLGLVLSSWWWLPCISNLDQSSGRALGVQTDPLLMLFPEFSRDFTLSVFNVISHRESLALLGCIPWVSIVSLLIIFTFCKTLQKSRMHAFFVVSVVLFLILPRNFFFQLFSTHLHYYRFTVCFFSCLVIFSSVGFSYWLNTEKHRGALLCFLLVGTFCLSLIRFDLRVGNFFDVHSLRTGHLADYPAGKEAEYVFSVLKEIHEPGNIIEEYSSSNGVALGTPHLFSTLLPLYAQKPVATGLLLESSMCGEFLYEIMYGLSRTEGRMNFWIPQEDGFYKNSSEDFINKLSQFNVKYIISYTPQLAENLMGSRQANLVFNGKWMKVFEVFSRPNKNIHRIYIEPSIIGTKEMSRELFRDPHLAGEVFVQGEQLFDDLSEELKSSFDVVLKIENTPYESVTKNKVNPATEVPRIRSALIRGLPDSGYNEISSIFSPLGKLELSQVLSLVPAKERKKIVNPRAASRILKRQSMFMVPCLEAQEIR